MPRCRSVLETKANKFIRGSLKATTNRKPKASFNAVVKALSASVPEHLVCRETELNTIRSFIDAAVEEERSACMYISGAPGTGKTACLTKLVQSLPKQVKVVWVNCMLLKTGPDIYSHVWKSLNTANGSVSQCIAKHSLDKFFASSRRVHVLVLDEIDYLDAKHQDVLYSIMEWPALKGSRVVLFGVANSLDLTERLLPRLHSFPGVKPTVLHFPPYTRQQLHCIVSTRVGDVAEAASVISPAAIHLLSAKISAIAGDARKALAVCSRSIEVAGKRTADSPASSDQENCPEAVAVGPAVVSSVLGEVYQHPVVHNAAKMYDTLPVHQKLVLCALLIDMKACRMKEIVSNKLMTTYGRVCRQHHVSPVSSCEFSALLTMLESQGIIGVKKSKQQTRVRLSLDEDEVKSSLLDDHLLSLIIKCSS